MSQKMVFINDLDAISTVLDIPDTVVIHPASFAASSVQDTTRPILLSLNPLNGATGVPMNGSIVFTFNELVQRGNGRINLLIKAGGSYVVYQSFDVSISPELVFSGNTLAIIPNPGLLTRNQYSITFDPDSIQDLAGNSYISTPYFFSSTTQTDSTPPEVSSFSPPNGGTGIPANTNIRLVFNEPIQKGIGLIQIRANSATGTLLETLDVTTSNNLIISDNILTINQSTIFTPGAKYFITLPKGVIRDVDGNDYLGNSTYNFIVAGTLDTTAPIVNNFSPANGATDATTNQNIELTFNEPVKLGAGKIEIRAGSVTGTVVESFDVASSQVLSFSTDNLKLIINPILNLVEGVQYFITLPKGTIKDMAGNDYAGTNSYSFTTKDTSSPTVIGWNPPDGGINVAIASDISLTFNEPIKKGTGNIEIHLDSANGELIDILDVMATKGVSIKGNSLTIKPTTALQFGKHYVITMPNGAVTDVSGNSYISTNNYDFTTIDNDPPIVTNFNPNNSSTGVATDGNIELIFNEPVRWGTGSIQLRTQSATGPVVEVFNKSTTGNSTILNNVLTLNPSTNLNPNTPYFITIANGTIKDVAGNAYIATATYSFTTTLDTNDPTVIAFSPSDGATGVPLDGGIEIKFNEPIVPGAGMIEIHVGSRLGPIIESFDVTSSEKLQFSSNKLIINPSAELQSQTKYFVVIPSGSVKDTSGNLYSGTSTYDFTTADTIAPIKTSSTPSEGQINVPIHPSIDISFNEPIKIGVGSIEIRIGSLSTGALAEKINITSSNISIVDNVLRVSLSQSLNFGTEYFLRIPPGAIKDIAGNSFQGLGYSFQTTDGQAGSFFNTANSDIFNGSTIIDKVIYNSPSDGFSISRVGNTNNWYVNGQGDDLLKGIERIWFSNKHIALDVGIEQNAGKALLFLSTINPNLIHNPAWLGEIIGLFDNGNSMESVFHWALNTANALSRPLSNQSLIQLVYHNLIGVDPNTATINSLLGFMDGRTASYSQAQFLTAVAELNIKPIELLGLQQTGIEYL